MSKDVIEKTLADYNDVFADIVNVLLFNGKEVINEDGLATTKDKSYYKIGTEIHEQERDVSKFYNDKEIRIAFLGIEHQTEPDKYMPLRVLSYDGSIYKAQISNSEYNNDNKYPVITLVLYFGFDKWNYGKSLYDAVSISDEWKPFVNDYKINLFEIAYLSPEQVNLFKSDFKYVADFLVQTRTNKHYVPSKEVLKHKNEVMDLLKLLTNDDIYDEIKENFKNKEAVTMSSIINYDAIRNREEGKAEGLISGFVKGYISKDAVVELLDITDERFEALVKEYSEKQ